MADLGVTDVVLALKKLHINVDHVMLRRIEWALGEGNLAWSRERLIDELSDLVLQRNRPWGSRAFQISLDDFLCDKGIPIQSYRQLLQSLHDSPDQSYLLNTVTLDGLDQDSSIVTFAQSHPARELILDTLRDLGLDHIRCRAILGLSTRTYERLKRRLKDKRKEELGRRGRSEDDAWSFAKHVVSETCLRLFAESTEASILILETHQGVGDASLLYRHYGHVLGFDNNEEAHQAVLERVQLNGFYRSARDLYLRRVAESREPWIFVTEEATSCEQGLQFLTNQGMRFNVIDVDPWTTSKPYFSDILQVLMDSGLVMLTAGDQHPWPKGETSAWERFGVESYSLFLSEDTKRVWRQTWMFLRRACAWYMRAAASRSFGLLPILIMRNLEPWGPRDDFPDGVMGVDRIYFLGRRIFDPDRLEQILESWTEPLPFFGEPALRTEVSGFARPSGALSFLSFTDEIWPAMRPHWPKYNDWLSSTAQDLTSRWRCPKSSEIVDAHRKLRQAVEQVCWEKVSAGLNLAQSWLGIM